MPQYNKEFLKMYAIGHILVRACCCVVPNHHVVCKIKYYNNCIFHTVIKDFVVQTGDPTGTGKGGESIYG